MPVREVRKYTPRPPRVRFSSIAAIEGGSDNSDIIYAVDRSGNLWHGLMIYELGSMARTEWKLIEPPDPVTT